MSNKSNSGVIKVSACALAMLCSSGLQAQEFGNLSVLDPAAVVFGGTNDVTAVWDGTLNSQADIVSGTLRENMVIESASGHPFFGLPWSVHDIYVFGPGSYSIETCPEPGSGGCQVPQPISFTVGPDQLGAHMLLDWGFNTDMDVALVWDINGQFPADQLYLGPAGPSPGPDTVWSLASVDGDGDGVPGVAMVDGPFIGFNWNFSLNIPPQSIGVDVRPTRPAARISQSSSNPVRVAIITRDALDATRIDPATLMVSDPTGRLAGATSDHLCRDRDANRDGRLDLVCRIEMTIQSVGSRVLRVDAETYEGLQLRGEDSVLIVP